MIKSKVGNIKSGWRSVFMIFTASADDDLESIVDSAFENVEQGKELFLVLFFVTPISRYWYFCFFITMLYLTPKNICSYLGTL